jgi:hypothetical protein
LVPWVSYLALLFLRSAAHDIRFLRTHRLCHIPSLATDCLLIW